MEIRKIPIDQLKPAKYNPRKNLKPGDPEYEKLRRSIDEFGYVEPIIWNEQTGNVVGGHQRLKVLKDLGITEVDCVVVDMDDGSEKALNVALNKISGDWDMDMLKELLSDMDADALELTGFDSDEIEKLLRPVESIDLDEDEEADDGHAEAATYHCPKCGFVFEVPK